MENEENKATHAEVAVEEDNTEVEVDNTKVEEAVVMVVTTTTTTDPHMAAIEDMGAAKTGALGTEIVPQWEKGFSVTEAKVTGEVMMVDTAAVQEADITEVQKTEPMEVEEPVAVVMEVTEAADPNTPLVDDTERTELGALGTEVVPKWVKEMAAAGRDHDFIKCHRQTYLQLLNDQDDLNDQENEDLVNELAEARPKSDIEKESQMKNEIEFWSSKASELETQNDSLKLRIKTLEDWINKEKQQEKELEIRREESQKKLAHYQDLLRIKTALDTTITSYRKLLEREEASCHSHPCQSEDNKNSHFNTGTTLVHHDTPVKSIKRKRNFFETGDTTSNTQVSTSAVIIQDHDISGKFIKLHNKGNVDISLGDWRLIRKAGEQENEYIFSNNIVIQSKSYITVWSSNAMVAHSPPTDLVMEGQNWFTADSMSSVLINNCQEQKASLEVIEISDDEGTLQ